MRRGGPDTGIPGANAAECQQTYDGYREGAMDRDQAVEQMAQTMRRERTSNAGQSYGDHYGNKYDAQRGGAA